MISQIKNDLPKKDKKKKEKKKKKKRGKQCSTTRTRSGMKAMAELRSGMKPIDPNPVTDTRHRDQNFYPGSQD